MKLATYKDGSRDGQLVVVAHDLSTAHYASHIVNRLQQALDDWNFIAPQLQDLYDALNHGRARHPFPFDPKQCMAPLPRASLWAQAESYDGGFADGSAERAAEASLVFGPPLFSGACDPVRCPSEQMDLDFGAGLAVITADVATRLGPEQTLEGVRLVMLVNDTRLRADGLRDAQRPLAVACSPVAVTPDELGAAWRRGRLHNSLQTSWNGRRVGMADAGADMRQHFGKLIAQLCATRVLGAGSVISAGPVRNRPESPARPQWPKGYHCIADKRAIELLQDGQVSTTFLRLGDSVRIEMKGEDGLSIFGAIDQEIVAPRALRVEPVRSRLLSTATDDEAEPDAHD